MTNLYTGTIDTEGQYQTLAGLTGLIFTDGNKYEIQIQNQAYVREGITGDGFLINSPKPFVYTKGNDDLYIKTNTICVVNVADYVSSGGGAEINNQDITVTENGVYEAESGYTGLGEVTVNVPAPTGLPLSTGQPVLMSAPLSNEVQGYKGQNETVTSTGSTYNYPNFVDKMSDFYDDGTNSTISENVNVIQKGGTMSDDFVFTGGSNTYLIVPDIAPLKTADSWEFKTKYKYTGGGNIPTVIGACGYAGDATYDTPILLVSDVSNKMWFKMWISSNGSSFDIASDVAANFAVTSGVTYYLKFGFNGTEYYLDYNTDGSDNYTRATTVTSSTKCNCTAPFMLMNLSYNPSTYYSSGTIDLKETSITINGNTWWNGTYNLQGKDYQGIKISKNNIKPFVQPVLSSNGTMGGNSFAVSASSEYSGQNGYAYKAFDGLYNKGDTGAWWATTNSNQWLTFYNPNPLCVKALNIQNGNNGYAVVQWELLGSNDNQNWTTITSGTNTDTSKYIFWTIDASSNTNYYKYYRINALTGTGYIVITEINIIADEKSNGDYWYLDDTNNTVQTPIIDNTKDIYFMVGDNYTASTTIIY